MFAPLLAAVLGAAPVDVVVFSDAHLAPALKKASPGRTQVDGTIPHAELLGETQNITGVRDFGAFTASPPRGWPAGLQPLWQESMKYCRELVGPPPWTQSMLPQAMTCGERLGKFLWQRYLAEVKADRVIVVTGWASNQKDESGARGEIYQPSAATGRRVNFEGTRAQLQALEDKALEALLKGDGAEFAREVVTELARQTPGDPYVGQAVVSKSLSLAKTCATLPPTLVITPDGVASTSLAARWAASVKGTGAPLQCALGFDEHEEDMMGQKMTVVAAKLRCGDQTVMTEGLLQPPRGGLSGVEIITNKLAAALAAKLCK